MPPPSNGSVAARGEIGNALDISAKEYRLLDMKMNIFEIEAMLSICLYQLFLTFVISFDCDTLITKSHFVLISDNV